MSSRIGARRLNVVLALGALVLGTLGGTFAVFESAAQATVNLSCPQGTTEYKVDSNVLNGLSNGESAQFTVNGQTFTITKGIGPSPFENDTFDFTSTIAVSVVFVKGGVDTNEYDYNPATTSGSALHPPLNSGGQPPTISHVVFCAGGSGTTTTTVPEETTTTVPEETTTVPEETTTTTVPEETTTTVPEETTTVPEETTTTTVPEETTTTVPEETTTTVPEETTTTTVPEETTTTLSVQGSTTIFIHDDTTTTQPQSTTTLTDQGGTVSTTEPVPVTVTGNLPRTGSGVAVPALFALSCIAAGVLLVASRRRSWSRP